METGNKKIISFTDLDVYQRSYRSAISANKIVLFLKDDHQYELADQLSRCTKAIPALIAEGYAKRYQPKHLQKYIDDGIGEANEATVHLSLARDLGYPDKKFCDDLINEYNIVGKQLFNFGKSWQNSKNSHSRPPTP